MRDLEDQLDRVEDSLRSDCEIRVSFREMTKLIRMFYVYLERRYALEDLYDEIDRL